MKYVMFEDSKVFNKNKVWDIKDIKSKYPNTMVESAGVFFITVKADGKELQRGFMIDGDSEYEALSKYMRLKDGSNT